MRSAIDWSRLAEPQVDGYDTDAVSRLAGDHAAAVPADVKVGEPWFAVAPVYDGRPDFRRDFARYAIADAGHPNLARAVDLVDTWSVGAAQARRLMRVLHAGLDPAVASDVGWETISTMSHSYEDAFGTMWATVHSALGLAEAIVHEMAHHKLRALGVRFESADRIVANPHRELYPSPLLGGRLRPMSAVVHAQYALLHMMALKVELLVCGGVCGPEADTLVRTLLRRDARLVSEGAVIVRHNLVVDDYGLRFMPALWRWQERLLAEVYA
jgi:HEXXH motif-containing protein